MDLICHAASTGLRLTYALTQQASAVSRIMLYVMLHLGKLRRRDSATRHKPQQEHQAYTAPRQHVLFIFSNIGQCPFRIRIICGVRPPLAICLRYSA